MGSIVQPVLVGFPNRIRDAVLTGGAYIEILPLENLKDRALAKVARTINAALSSTWFTMDLTRSRSIRILAIIKHNMSFSARLRIRASDDPTFTTTRYDEVVDAWPAANSDWNIDELEWENDNYWLGSFSQEDVEGQTPVFSIVFPQLIQARYWRIDIQDNLNSDGFVDLGRVFIGDGFLTPALNFDNGSSFTYEDNTAIETAISGAEFFDPREPLRVFRFSLSQMSQDEAFTQALELNRRAGIWREVFLVINPAEIEYPAQMNFLGRLRQLSQLELLMHNTNAEIYAMAFEVKELR